MSLLTGLAAYWKFDENTGTSASDASGNGNASSLTGSYSWSSSGIINGCIDFTGGTGTTSNFSSNLTSISTYSMNCWVNVPNITTNGYGFIMGLRFDIGTSKDSFYLLQLTNSGKIEARFVNSSGTQSNAGGSSNTLTSINTWYMLTLIYDGSTLYFYANASLVNSVSASGTFGSGTLPQLFGNDGFGHALTGLVDEAAFWSRALSSSEVSRLYNGGAGLQYPFNIGVIPALFIPSVSIAIDRKMVGY